MRAIPPCLVALVILSGMPAPAAAQGAPTIKWMRGGHVSYITQLVHSSDGSFFASAASDRTVKIWRSADNVLLRTFIVTGGTRALALSPDDGTICAGGSTSPALLPFIQCWNVADGTELWNALSPGGVGGDLVTKLAFSPDGARLAAAVGVKLPIFDAMTGGFITDFSGPPNSFAGGLSYSPDGTVLAVNANNGSSRLAFANAATGAMAWDSAFTFSVAADLAFSNDGQYVASVNGNGLHVYRNSDHAAQAYAAGGAAFNVAFGPSGARLADGNFGNLTLWNTSSGAIIRSWTGHTGPGVNYTPMTFTADSTRLISGVTDLKRWKASDGTFDTLISGQVGPLYLIAMSANESVMAAYGYNGQTDEHVIGLFRGSDGALLRHIEVGTEALRGLALSPDGKHVAAADNVQMRVWNVSSGALEQSRAEAGLGSSWRPLAYTPDGTAIAEGGDSGNMNVQLWNPTTNVETFIVAGPATVLRFLPNPDGRLVVGRQVVSNGNASQVNIVTLAGHVDKSFFGLSNINAVDVSPDGLSIVAGGIDGGFSPAYVARIWRVSDGAVLQTLVGHTDAVNGVAFSWDSKTVVTASRDTTLRIWKASDGSQVHLYDNETFTFTTIGYPGLVSALASRLSGTFIYGRGDATLVAAVNPEAQPKLQSVKVPALATGGCKAVSVNVTLDRPAPPAGLIVSLASSSPTATVPATLAFKSGNVTKSFKVTTSPVQALESATISVTLDGTTLEGDLGIRPLGIKSVTLLPTTVVGGGTSAGTVTLECNAIPGDVLVNLQSSLPSVAQPTVPAITIPQGMSAGTFVVATTPVTATKKPSIQASTMPDAVKKSRTLAVTP